MTPDRQTSESHKYIPRPLTLIPVDGVFHVFEAYGSTRRFLGAFPPAELIDWLAADFLARQTANVSSLTRYTVRRVALPDIDSSALSGIDLKL